MMNDEFWGIPPSFNGNPAFAWRGSGGKMHAKVVPFRFLEKFGVNSFGMQLIIL
jgi:hypothetical protein